MNHINKLEKKKKPIPNVAIENCSFPTFEDDI